MFLLLPNTVKFFSWPKFVEGCCNYHMIPVHSRAVTILPSGAKGMTKYSQTILPFDYYFAVDLVSILPQFGK